MENERQKKVLRNRQISQVWRLSHCWFTAAQVRCSDWLTNGDVIDQCRSKQLQPARS